MDPSAKSFSVLLNHSNEGLLERDLKIQLSSTIPVKGSSKERPQPKADFLQINNEGHIFPFLRDN